MKLAVLISGSGSNLQALIHAIDADRLPADIALVLSNRADAPGLQRAARAGLATLVLDHCQYASRDAFDAALLEELAPRQVDLILLAGFMRILTPAFVAAYRGRILNIHPSLLPNYPGLHTHQRAIAAGDSEAGATVHFVTDELDGGPPILQARVPIEPGDDAATLAQRVLAQEHRIYPLAVAWWVAGRLQLAADGARLDGTLIPPGGLALGQLDSAGGS